MRDRLMKLVLGIIGIAISIVVGLIVFPFEFTFYFIRWIVNGKVFPDMPTGVYLCELVINLLTK